jgi:hypothetical protein
MSQVIKNSKNCNQGKKKRLLFSGHGQGAKPFLKQP